MSLLVDLFVCNEYIIAYDWKQYSINGLGSNIHNYNKYGKRNTDTKIMRNGNRDPLTISLPKPQVHVYK